MKKTKTHLVFPKHGNVEPIQATHMDATANSIRFYLGKRLIAIYDLSNVDKAGEEACFPEREKLDPARLSVATLNDWVAKLPKDSRS